MAVLRSENAGVNPRRLRVGQAITIPGTATGAKVATPRAVLTAAMISLGVAARTDEGGVLVLSEMTGAAQELTDALIISPYDIDGFARAIQTAIEMPGDERRRRMRAMRRAVAGHDVFLWASDILEGLERASPPPRAIRGAEMTDRLSPVG